MPQTHTLTEYERACYERILTSGEAALARWSATAPLRALIERNVADARQKLGLAA